MAEIYGLREQFLSKDSNFHIVRHLAALGVIFNHSYILETGGKSDQPLRALLGISFGEISLDFFFLVSGYFIALSVAARDNLWRFLAVRSARLHPALIMALLLGCFVVAPLFGSLSLQELLQEKGVYHYIIQNALMLFGMVFNLPGGVFADNPFPHSVNGAIWTLAVEARLILALGVAWWLLKPVKARAHLLSWLALAVAISCLSYSSYLRISGEYVHPGWRLHWMFLLGVWIRLAPINIPLLKQRHIGLFFVLFVAGGFLGKEYFPIVWPLLSPFLILSISFLNIGLLRKFTRSTDYSYGMFVYAFPIQQSIVHLGLVSSPVGLFVTSLLFAIPIAALSWHCLEKPLGKFVKSKLERDC